jgi:hypothetical protein
VSEYRITTDSEKFRIERKVPDQVRGWLDAYWEPHPDFPLFTAIEPARIAITKLRTKARGWIPVE